MKKEEFQQNMKDRMQQFEDGGLRLLKKVEEKHSITSQHTDKSGKSRLDNCCHIIACPNFHDEEGRQQHPNNTDNLFRNLT